jgi:hypothetical protein
VHRTRRIVCLLALILALPSAAFAQGAGDDQYQDPFAEEPTAQQQQQQPPEQDGGLGDEPPTDGGGGSQGQGNGGESEQTPAPAPAPTPREDPNALPRTGADPRPLVLIGAAFLLAGIGLRLRTIDPDAY